MRIRPAVESSNPRTRMKTSLIICILLCAGCQSAPVPTTPNAVHPVVKPASTDSPSASAELERKLTRQARLMAALIEQNDVLAEKLRAEPPVTPAAIPAPLAPPPGVSVQAAVAPIPPPEDPQLPLHAPNGDGLIDLSIPTGPAGAAVNPFALRAGASETRREISLLVQAIVAGPNTCALINERMCEPGDAIESLRVDRIEADAVILRGDGYRLRIPPTEKPVRVRLPL